MEMEEQVDHTKEKQLLEKFKELKALFKFGGEILPFMEELFLFVMEVLPLMETLSQSLRETNRNMPRATNRLDKVNKASETATHTIMDKLDTINGRLKDISQRLHHDRSHEEIQQIVTQIQDDTMDITAALQFQDITSQQLRHVQTLLTAIQERFAQLFTELQSLEISDQLKQVVFRNQELKHPMLNHSIEKAGKDTIRTGGISQEEIDLYFRKNF